MHWLETRGPRRARVRHQVTQPPPPQRNATQCPTLEHLEPERRANTLRSIGRIGLAPGQRHGERCTQGRWLCGGLGRPRAGRRAARRAHDRHGQPRSGGADTPWTRYCTDTDITWCADAGYTLKLPRSRVSADDAPTATANSPRCTAQTCSQRLVGSGSDAIPRR